MRCNETESLVMRLGMLIGRIRCSVGLWDWTECLGPLLGISRSEQWPAKQAPWDSWPSGYSTSSTRVRQRLVLARAQLTFMVSLGAYKYRTCTIVLAVETALYGAVPYSN